MLMRRAEELLPAATVPSFAEAAAASSLYNFCSSKLTVDSDYWTTISASPPLPHSQLQLLQQQLPSTMPQQGSMTPSPKSFQLLQQQLPSTTMQQHQQQHLQRQQPCSVLSPALLLEELVLEDGDEAFCDKSLKRQQRQLSKQLLSCSIRSKEIVSPSNDDNNNTNNSEDTACGRLPVPATSLHQELQKLIFQQQDEAWLTEKCRPRTYSIESLFERRDPNSDFRKWTDDDPMWNENLYIEIDEETEDCGSGSCGGGGGGSGLSGGSSGGSGPSGVRSSKYRDSSSEGEDILSLFPFPLSISSPPLPSSTGSDANAPSPNCANAQATNYFVGNGLTGESFVVVASSPSPTCESQSSRQLLPNSFVATAPTSKTVPKSSRGSLNDADSQLDSILPDDVFEEEEEDGGGNKKNGHLKNSSSAREDDLAIASIANISDKMIGEVDEVVELAGFSVDAIATGLDVDEDAEDAFLTSEEFGSTDLITGMTTSSEDGVNCFMQSLDVDELLRVVAGGGGGSGQAEDSMVEDLVDDDEDLDQQHPQPPKQLLHQQQQQQQHLSRQRRQSFSRRQRQQQQLRQQQQRRRRRSWTVIKPKIYRHASLKNAKSPTRGIAHQQPNRQLTKQQVQHQKQQLQHQKQQLQLQKQQILENDFHDDFDEEPVVSTSSMPLDHQGLCKPIDDRCWNQNQKGPQSNSFSKSTVKTQKEKNSVQISREPEDVAAAIKAREHLNIVERQRRFVLAQAMDKLRDELPYQCDDERRKLSKLEILRGAKEFINRLRLQEVALEEEKAELKQKQKALVKRFNFLSSAKK